MRTCIEKSVWWRASWHFLLSYYVPSLSRRRLSCVLAVMRTFWRFEGSGLGSQSSVGYWESFGSERVDARKFVLGQSYNFPGSIDRFPWQQTLFGGLTGGLDEKWLHKTSYLRHFAYCSMQDGALTSNFRELILCYRLFVEQPIDLTSCQIFVEMMLTYCTQVLSYLASSAPRQQFRNVIGKVQRSLDGFNWSLWPNLVNKKLVRGANWLMVQFWVTISLWQSWTYFSSLREITARASAQSLVTYEIMAPFCHLPSSVLLRIMPRCLLPEEHDWDSLKCVDFL